MEGTVKSKAQRARDAPMEQIRANRPAWKKLSRAFWEKRIFQFRLGSDALAHGLPQLKEEDISGVGDDLCETTLATHADNLAARATESLGRLWGHCRWPNYQERFGVCGCAGVARSLTLSWHEDAPRFSQKEVRGAREAMEATPGWLSLSMSAGVLHPTPQPRSTWRQWGTSVDAPDGLHKLAAGGGLAT